MKPYDLVASFAAAVSRGEPMAAARAVLEELQNHVAEVDETLRFNLSTVFAGQNVGVRQLSDKIWLVSFMHYDLGFFDDETSRLEPVLNPFEARVLPMSPV
jgi:hypothetical protein